MTKSTIPNFNSSRWIWIALAISLVGVLLWNIRNILLYGLGAIILVILVSMPVRFLARYKVGRTPAIFASLVAGVVLIYLISSSLLPTFVDQFVRLGDSIAQGIDQIVEYWNSGELQESYPFLVSLPRVNTLPESTNLALNNLRVNPFTYEVSVVNFDTQAFQIDAETIRSLAEQAFNAVGQLGGTVLPFITGLANTLLTFLIVIFLTMFFLAEPDKYTKGFIKIFPLWYRDRVEYILKRIDYLLRRWIVSQFIGMAITFAGTYLGLAILQIDQAVALAILAAIFSLVPNFGQLLAVLVAVLVASVQAPDRLVLIVIVIYGVSFIQGQIIAPILTSGAVDIPPVLFLLGQIIAAGFFGVLGIVLTGPLLVIVMVIIQEVYVKDILGDRGVMQEKSEPIALKPDDSELVMAIE
ncbi:MAG: AI-2E family transporter [Anaerolineae bacterium]|jgi:predicted PurR-regulated permease PerM|nr:AI-2E family transporter [Anaerolineae bacterium]